MYTHKFTQQFQAQALALQKVLHQEQNIRGALRQTPHEVRIPLRAKRHIDSDSEAQLRQPSLQVAPDAIEHLELERSLRNTLLTHELQQLLDDRLVMRRDPAEVARGHHPLS